MRKIIYINFILMIGHCFCCSIYAESYPWLENHNDSSTIESRIIPPGDFYRKEVTHDSFTHWLRRLPLKTDSARVHFYNEKEKDNQKAHYAVVDIDTGDKDLQQCADAVIRLRSEYLFSQNKTDSISFNFTSGDKASFRRWIDGYRPVVNGNDVNWIKSAITDSSYSSFRDYLNRIFMYCGTYSLSKELAKVEDIYEIQPGDVFIQGGFPGHAIIVIDVVEDNKKNKLFILGQGFTPAQDIHILNNPNDPNLSPWYDINFGNILKTPEWTFKKTDLKRFK